MEMLNKIRSAVTSALPGNPLSKDFDVYSQVGSGGPGLQWKIFNAVTKTTKQEASLFMFEKRQLERFSKRDREIILEALKKGASQLTRLRHPKVLSVLHPLEESRETLAFATEPVFASLANVLGNHENLPTPLPQELQEYTLYDVEIKYGMLQVTEGLAFLHNDVKLLHQNICPESIIITKLGSWKLAGFDFCSPNTNKQDQAPLFIFQEWDPDIPPLAQPNLDFMAPEYALTMTCGLPSDMFSMGVLIYAIFNSGKPLFECKCLLSAFRKNSEELRKWRGSLLGSVPTEIREYVKLLLNTEPSVRPDPDQLTKIPYFQDVGSMTLLYMDTLFQRDNLQKSQFFKGLPKIICKLPKRVNQQRILPPLFKECVNADMIPFVLPSVLWIAEQSRDKEYVALILPDLIPMFKIRTPVQIMLLFMQNMNLLLSKTPQTEIRTHVLPMIYVALESNSYQIQELCLNIIPTFADLIEYNSFKNAIVPRIKKVCLSTSSLQVRVNCLLCLGKLLEHMDKWFVLDEVFPLLSQIPSREPAVLMSILGIYQVAMNHSKLGITKDIMASKVLPFIIPLSMDNNLNLKQFTAFMSLVKEMIGKVESEHKSKLQQLDQMKQEQQNLEITKITGQEDKELIGSVGPGQPQTMMDKFLSGFGMSALVGSSSIQETAQNSSGAVSSDTLESNMDSKGPVAPAKVSLSLEEKQKLAKEQERQRFHKTQKPLQAKTNSNPDKTSSTGTGVKDLTSTLMGMQSSANQQSRTSSGPSMRPMSNSMTSVGQSSMSMPRPMMNPGAGISGIGHPSFGGQSTFTPNRAQSAAPVDLSAFDTLLPSSSQQRVPMNQQTASVPAQAGGVVTGSGMMGNQLGSGMMGNMNMTGNQNMVGMQRTMENPGFVQPGMGMQYNQGLVQSSFGNQGLVQSSFGNQSMGMGQFSAQPMTGQTMLQPQPAAFQKQNGQSTSGNTDLSDIFG